MFFVIMVWIISNCSPRVLDDEF